ncbi:putative MFS family arabinose efflux permease [Saccharopolyspora lacisalsi]|uniref:Putative MFS family arabinose efflux permease n=1 Tax=Halosaccharopolyspora lacisalsi TaxID=1000566 RepID=A0A839DUP1_9PSEU|nr:MFS transporter [Halosaccharopolyspora lacisalsi]MBA8823986.1 putative MFS family arabinose efflux permease [Halosaccharopolyspora lacisalsi]
MTQGIETSSPVRGSRVHRAWWVALGACLAILGAGAFSTMSGLLVNPLHQEFEWSRSTIGIAVAVNMVLYGLTAPFAAALMDRFGIRRVIAGALTIISAGAALTTIMTEAWQLILYWGLLIGLGTGSMAMAFAATVANRWFVRRRGVVSGLLTAASVFGQFVFLPLLAWIIAHYQWRSAIVTLALTALITIPLVWLLLRDHPADVGLTAYGAGEFTPKPAADPGAARRTVRVLVEAARTGQFWLLATTFAICGATTNGIMWTHFVPAARDHGMPITVAASLLTMIGIFNVVGTIGSGWLTDRYDPRKLHALYFPLRGVLLLLLPQLLASTVQPSVVFFMVAFGVLDVATVPPMIELCRRFYGDNGAIVFGWVNATHQVGAGLMALAASIMRESLGSYAPVWIVSAALCVIAGLLALMIKRHDTDEHGSNLAASKHQAVETG